MNTNVEYQAFIALYDTLQTGIKSGIDDIVGKAFAERLIPPHVKSVSGNSSGPQCESTRTAILLDAILEKIHNLPEAYKKFAGILEKIPAFLYLADMMKDKRSEVAKEELERHEIHEQQKQVEKLLQDKKEALHISLDMEDESHRSQTNVYHPESLPSSFTAIQRSADVQFSVLHSFPQGELGQRSPLGFLGRASVSSTPGMSPRNLSLISKLDPLHKTSVPGSAQTNKQPPQVKSTLPEEPLGTSDTIESELGLRGCSYEYNPIHKSRPSDQLPDDSHHNVDVSKLHSTLQTLSVQPKNGTSETDAHTEPSDPLQLPSNHNPPDQTISTVAPVEDIPSVQTVPPTPMIALPPSTMCPSECSSEDQPTVLVIPGPMRALSNTSQVSVESSLSSEGFVTAPSSPETDYEDNPIDGSDESLPLGTVACRQKRQQYARSSSREHYIELKKKLEEASKEVSKLQIQCYIQQSAHSKKEAELLEELKAEREEKVELLVKLENSNHIYLDLQVSLRQHQKYISVLENKLCELNKRIEDVNSELKDVKVDAYDKGRELESLRKHVKNCEMELEFLRKVPV